MKVVSLCLALLSSQIVAAQDIKVSLDPIYPFVVSETEGLTINFLRQIESHSDFTFDISVKPYDKVKRDLKTNRTQLIGHTSHQKETESFYMFANELNFELETKVDAYAINSKYLNEYFIIKDARIGTPPGNQCIFSELYGIPSEHFVTGSIAEILELLNDGEIDVVLFERSSVMSQILKLGLTSIQYQMVDDTIPLGLAVRKDIKGKYLKMHLERIIAQLDVDSIFQEQNGFYQLPNSGSYKEIALAGQQ